MAGRIVFLVALISAISSSCWASERSKSMETSPSSPQRSSQSISSTSPSATAVSSRNHQRMLGNNSQTNFASIYSTPLLPDFHTHISTPGGWLLISPNNVLMRTHHCQSWLRLEVDQRSLVCPYQQVVQK